MTANVASIYVEHKTEKSIPVLAIIYRERYSIHFLASAMFRTDIFPICSHEDASYCCNNNNHNNNSNCCCCYCYYYYYYYYNYYRRR